MNLWKRICFYFRVLWFFVLFYIHVPAMQCSIYNTVRHPKKLESTFFKLGISNQEFRLIESYNGNQHVTNLDQRLRWLVVYVRHRTLSKTNMNESELKQQLYKDGKIQKRISDNVLFPCETKNGRSAITPTSVHRLRPGDIDVIAAFGDSLTAGNGIFSQTITHIINENRGISFSGGGNGSWRKYLTLPNILKEFNRNLYGYATSDGLAIEKYSKLNIAEPMIMSRDLPFQASVFIDRLTQDSYINISGHWKMLTIFVGSNDICSDMCHHNSIDEFITDHERDLRKTFELLRDNIPRLLINLIPVPNMITTIYPMTGKPMSCDIIHRIGCHCIFNDKIDSAKAQKISNDITRWQQMEKYLTSLPEFNTDDFAIVYQPFTSNASVPLQPDGKTDFRFWASDCFHFSQLGQAALANALWNNLLQPMDKKDKSFVQPFSKFLCPTESDPYIKTS